MRSFTPGSSKWPSFQFEVTKGPVKGHVRHSKDEIACRGSWTTSSDEELEDTEERLEDLEQELKELEALTFGSRGTPARRPAKLCGRQDAGDLVGC